MPRSKYELWVQVQEIQAAVLQTIPPDFASLSFKEQWDWGTHAMFDAVEATGDRELMDYLKELAEEQRTYGKIRGPWRQ